MKIVFFGDSITDMGRGRGNVTDIYSRGSSYVFLLSCRFDYEYPHQFEIVNSGNSGDTLYDLETRYMEDVVKHHPDVVSVFIGINDHWGIIDRVNHAHYRPKQFEEHYVQLLENMKKELPDVKFILVQPYVLHGTIPDARGYDKFMKITRYDAIIRRIGRKMDIPVVNLQKDLDKNAALYGPENYAYDGIHPYFAGAQIIANNWFKVFKKNYLK